MTFRFGHCDSCTTPRNKRVLHKCWAPGRIETYACAECRGWSLADDSGDLSDEIERRKLVARTAEDWNLIREMEDAYNEAVDEVCPYTLSLLNPENFHT